MSYSPYAYTPYYAPPEFTPRPVFRIFPILALAAIVGIAIYAWRRKRNKEIPEIEDIVDEYSAGKWCSFCDSEAVAKIERSGAFLCGSCKEAYVAGQSNPDGELDDSEGEYCSFCEAEAESEIKRSGAFLCGSCKEAYVSGQSNPEGGVILSTKDTPETADDDFFYKVSNLIDWNFDPLLKKGWESAHEKGIWIVTVPTKSSELADIVFSRTFVQMDHQFRGGLLPREIVGTYGNKDDAEKVGKILLSLRDQLRDQIGVGARLPGDKPHQGDVDNYEAQTELESYMFIKQIKGGPKNKYDINIETIDKDGKTVSPIWKGNVDIVELDENSVVFQKDSDFPLIGENR